MDELGGHLANFYIKWPIAFYKKGRIIFVCVLFSPAQWNVIFDLFEFRGVK